MTFPAEMIYSPKAMNFKSNGLSYLLHL